MKLAEIELIRQFVKLNIDPEILKMLPEPIIRIDRRTPDCFILDGTERSWALWLHGGREQDLRCWLNFLAECQNQGFNGFLKPVVNQGSNYKQLDQRTWAYLTEWPAHHHIHFRRYEDITAIVTLICNLKRIRISNDLSEELKLRYTGPNLLEQYQTMIKNFHSFQMLAQYRVRPSEFDRLFLSYVRKLVNQADNAYRQLKDSVYITLINRPERYSLVLTKLSRNNFGWQINGSLCYLGMNKWGWNLAVSDLAFLILKAGHSNHWNREWFRNVVDHYRSQYPISSEEIEVIRCYLAFPWEQYRLAQKYFFNLSDMPLRSYLEKFQRRLADEQRKLLFLNEINQRYSEI